MSSEDKGETFSNFDRVGLRPWWIMTENWSPHNTNICDSIYIDYRTGIQNLLFCSFGTAKKRYGLGLQQKGGNKTR